MFRLVFCGVRKRMGEKTYEMRFGRMSNMVAGLERKICWEVGELDGSVESFALSRGVGAGTSRSGTVVQSHGHL